MNSKQKRRSRVVATRVFRTDTGGDVIATIHEPMMIRSDEWRCDFRISGLSTEVEDHGDGVDSVQALIIAMQGIRTYLDRAGESLTWLDGESGDYGIPHLIPHEYGVAVERHLTKLVGDEVARLIDAKRMIPKPG